MKDDCIIINASITHLDLLSQMYYQLRCDEEIDDIKSPEELLDLMKGFLESDHYSIHLMMHYETIVGYALIELKRNPLYLKHLFIKKEFRGKGLGKQLIQELSHIYKTDKIDIEVMSWNTKALAFYNKLGFYERYKGMRLSLESKEI